MTGRSEKYGQVKDHGRSDSVSEHRLYKGKLFPPGTLGTLPLGISDYIRRKRKADGSEH